MNFVFDANEITAPLLPPTPRSPAPADGQSGRGGLETDTLSVQYQQTRGCILRTPSCRTGRGRKQATKLTEKGSVRLSWCRGRFKGFKINGEST